MLAEAAYIEAVDQNIAILPLGRSLDPNATGLILLTPAADYYRDVTPRPYVVTVDSYLDNYV